jgi:spore germination protein GerM
MGKERSRKKTSFGVVFWIAVILLIVIIFLFNLPVIRDVLENTGFVEVVFEERDRNRQDLGDSAEPIESEDDRREDTERVDGDGQTDAVEVQPGPDESEPDDPDTDVGDPVVEIETPESADEPQIVVPPPEETEDEGPDRTRRTTLFFIRVSDDGRVLAEPVQRTIRFTGGPLTHTLEALISGPNAEDLNSGLLSLIPSDTELLSARVSDGVAYLNFNEAFRFNTMGVEGYLAQLQQVVQTATVFSTVDAVQILINGQVLEYLGGDGVYVGEPLTPGDVRTR